MKTFEEAVERLEEIPSELVGLKLAQIDRHTRIMGNPVFANVPIYPGQQPEAEAAARDAMNTYQRDQVAIDALLWEQENLRAMLPHLPGRR